MIARMRTVADVIADRLARAGATHLFGVPGGGSNLDLIDAAARAGIRFVLTATETGAAIAALAQAEVSGSAGICLTTLGPGAASVVNGVACALLDRAPLLVFCDSHADANRSDHQRIDQQALFSGITKASFVLSAADAGEIVDRALAIALAPPRGPVHLECPGDVLSRELVRGLDAVKGAATVSATASPPKLDDRVVRFFASARRPVLLAGLDARSPQATAAIRKLSEALGIPTLVTYKAKGVLPDSHPWFAGVFTNGSIERDIVARADVLIGAGLDPVELIPRPWSYTAPLVGCGPAPSATSHIPFAAQVTAPVETGLALLADLLARSDWAESDAATVSAEARNRIGIPVERLSAVQAVSTAAETLGPGTRITVDAGAHMFPVTIGWPVEEPNRLLISNGLSTMGFAMPAAIGAALADSAIRVAAITGDGGLLMCLGELATAVRESLNIIVLVFADRSLSLIDIKQRHRQLPRRGVDLGPVSWCAIAQGMGATAFSARTAGELECALRQAVACDGPSVVEVEIDPDNYARMLTTIRGSS